MKDQKPTLDDVRELLVAMLEHNRNSWIGEGNEIAEELLAYIDGKSPESLKSWSAGLDDRIYLITDDPRDTRGPFKSEADARYFLTQIPEQGVAVSQYGRTRDRANYTMICNAEWKAWRDMAGDEWYQRSSWTVDAGQSDTPIQPE